MTTIELLAHTIAKQQETINKLREELKDSSQYRQWWLQEADKVTELTNELEKIKGIEVDD